MDTGQIVVLIGGLALIGLILWYFFGEQTKTQAQVTANGVQEVDITVKGGYAPSVISVQQGRPVRLNFYRDETGSCSEQVVLGDFGIVRDLPAFQRTPVEFTPDRAGEFVFTCGMNMLRGKLIVRPRDRVAGTG